MRGWLLAACLAVWGGRGVLVVVLGDSNANGLVTTADGAPFYWPARLSLPRGFALENRAVPAMRAGDARGCSGNMLRPCRTDAQCAAEGTCVVFTLPDGQPGSGRWRTERLLAEFAGYRRWACALAAVGLAPRAIVALGTNDLPDPHITGTQIGAAVLQLYDLIHAAQPCVRLFVLTIPPRRDVPAAKIAEANVAITLGMMARPGGLIDCAPVVELEPDGVHWTAAGQAACAARAQAGLFPSG